MPFNIVITEEAETQLRSLSAREQRIVEAGIMSRLVGQPTEETKAIKRLRPNPLAEFEVRIENFRVLYNVDEVVSEVTLLIVGKKVGNKLIVAGEEFDGHKSDSG